MFLYPHKKKVVTPNRFKNTSQSLGKGCTCFTDHRSTDVMWSLSTCVLPEPSTALHQGGHPEMGCDPLSGKACQQNWASRTQPWLFIRVDIQGLAVTRCRGRSISRARCGPLSQVYSQNLLLCATHWRAGRLHSEMSLQTGLNVFGFQVCKVPSRTPCFHFWQGHLFCK